MACDDGNDNDVDGTIDFRTSSGDPGCASPTDTSERGGSNICDDGVDQDVDGKADYRTDAAGDAG